MDQAEIAALLGIDGVRAITNQTGVSGESDYQAYRFRVAGDPASLRSIVLRWAGFGESVPGYQTSLSVWNRTLGGGSGDWEQLSSGVWGDLTEIKATLEPPADYVDSSGNVYVMARAVNAVDAEILSGPTVTQVAPTTVRVTWTTRGPSTSRVEYGPDASYGSTAGTGAMSVSHSVDVSVEPTATYHYIVRS